jgi:hypothetical protein
MNCMVIIVIDPKRGLKEDNLKGIGFNGPERCPHLVGDKPGEYVCSIHERIWYKKTPCFAHGQIENGDTPCRMGVYVLGLEKENSKEL